MTDCIDSLCKCGKTIKYSHSDGRYSCNKYVVCPSHEELTKLYDAACAAGLKYEHVLNRIVKEDGEAFEYKAWALAILKECKEVRE